MQQGLGERTRVLEDWRSRQEAATDKLLDAVFSLTERASRLEAKITDLEMHVTELGRIIEQRMSNGRIISSRWQQVTVSALTTGIMMLLLELLRR